LTAINNLIDAVTPVCGIHMTGIPLNCE